MHPHRTTSLAVLVLLPLLFSGCGSHDQTKETAQGESQSTAPESDASESTPDRSSEKPQPPANSGPNPADVTANKLLAQFTTSDIATFGAEMSLEFLLSGSAEEGSKKASDVRQELDGLKKLPADTVLANIPLLPDLLGRSSIKSVTLKLTQTASGKLDAIKSAIGEPPTTSPGTVRATARDPITGQTEDRDFEISWYEWQWAAIAVYDNSRIIEMRLDGNKWRTSRDAQTQNDAPSDANTNGQATRTNEPELDRTVTLDRVTKNGETYDGKKVQWEGKLISMDRNSEARTIHMVFLANETQPKSADDMQLFAVDCTIGEIDEDLVFKVGTTEKRVEITGTIKGTDEVKVTLSSDASHTRQVPLLTAPVFRIRD